MSRYSQLFNRYPLFLRGRSYGIKKNLMGFGFECGPGWYSLINDICARGEKECKTLIARGYPVEQTPLAVQVKEKFGGLRFYAHNCSDSLFDFIEDQCSKSESLCDECGKPSVISGDTWLSSTCASCNEKLKEDRVKYNKIKEISAEKFKSLMNQLIDHYSGVKHLSKLDRISFIKYCLINRFGHCSAGTLDTLLKSTSDTNILLKDVICVKRSVKRHPKSAKSSLYYVNMLVNNLNQ